MIGSQFIKSVVNQHLEELVVGELLAVAYKLAGHLVGLPEALRVENREGLLEVLSADIAIFVLIDDSG